MPKLGKDVKKAINKMKKWNERIEVSRHIAVHNGESYYYVLFLNIFGIPQGSMAVREDGLIPDINLAKSLIFKISSYNNL